MLYWQTQQAVLWKVLLSLFLLLNDIAVFLRESYKCMQKWEEISMDKHHR